MAMPDIFSKKGDSIVMCFCSFGFTSSSSLAKNSIHLCKKLKQESLESIMPSSSNRFLIPKTKSTFSCISETNVKISNLCFCIVITTWITNRTPTYCPFPTCILLVVEVNFGIACRLLHCM